MKKEFRQMVSTSQQPTVTMYFNDCQHQTLLATLGPSTREMRRQVVVNLTQVTIKILKVYCNIFNLKNRSLCSADLTLPTSLGLSASARQLISQQAGIGGTTLR